MVNSNSRNNGLAKLTEQLTSEPRWFKYDMSFSWWWLGDGYPIISMMIESRKTYNIL